MKNKTFRREIRRSAGRVLPDDFRIPLEDPRVALFYLLSLSTGIRVSEALSLRVEDVIEMGNVKQTIRFRAKGGDLDEIDLAESVRAAIRAYLTDYRRGAIEGWLFPGGPKGRSDGRSTPRRLDRVTMWWLWTQAQKAAGVHPPYRLHDLRHTAITRMAQLTHGDLFLTQAFARHRSATSTQVYVHTNRLDLRKNMAALAEKYNQDGNLPKE